MHPARMAQEPDPRCTSERYFGLVAGGVLGADERVELLEGVIVAMAPQSPRHAGTIHRVARALRRALGDLAEVREDKPLVLGPYSVPEPDVAVVPPEGSDYTGAHPTTALLVVEVADSSLPQDRLTKAGIYAAAGIPEYWIVNLRDACVEVFRDPQPPRRRYGSAHVARRDDALALAALPDVRLRAGDLLPGTST